MPINRQITIPPASGVHALDLRAHGVRLYFWDENGATLAEVSITRDNALLLACELRAFFGSPRAPYRAGGTWERSRPASAWAWLDRSMLAATAALVGWMAVSLTAAWWLGRL